MPQNLVKVYTGSSINVLAIMSALESENVYPLIKDRSESARLAGFGATSIMHQELFVPKEAKKKTLEIIRSLDL